MFIYYITEVVLLQASCLSIEPASLALDGTINCNIYDQAVSSGILW